GFRGHMWGEKIVCNLAFRLTYTADIPAEDTTPDESYKIFYLKNLSIRFNNDAGVLPVSRFVPYLFRAGGLIFDTIREFREVRKWVKLNRFRFKLDARSVTELWESEV
ncbi:MAG: hypothetical protein AB1798_10500, partial [Spirochaetota bacterium]